MVYLGTGQFGFSSNTISPESGNTISAGTYALSLAGPIALTTAASRIIPGATSFALRDSTNTFDNLLLDAGGNGTFRGSVTITNGIFNLGTNGVIFTGAVTALWVGGSTGVSIRNNANTADNLLITDAGVATFRLTSITTASTTTAAGLRLPHGTAPSAPVDGDLWSTTTGLFVRINGATKAVVFL